MESGDTKGINLISMKPFLLTIVGPFQASNPPYFKAGFVIKLLGFFFPKLMVFSKDFYCCYNLDRLRIPYVPPPRNQAQKQFCETVNKHLSPEKKKVGFVAYLKLESV